MSFGLIAFVLAQAAAAQPATVEGPIAMTAKEVREYNATLSRSDPAYIRCQRIRETGSLVKKTTTCRTNSEWNRLAAAGERAARDMQESSIMHGHSTRGS